MCVKDCLVVARGGGVYHHLGCGFVCGLVLFDDVGPKHTSGAEFGDFHKKVGGYAHIEFDATGGFIDAYAGLGEGCHPLCAPSQCVSEFFVDERACIAEHRAVDINNAECGNVLDSLDEATALDTTQSHRGAPWRSALRRGLKAMLPRKASVAPCALMYSTRLWPLPRLYRGSSRC